MKKLLSTYLALVLLLSSLAPLSAIAQNDAFCENGVCAADLVDQLKELGTVFKQQCLPKEEKWEKPIEQYFEENGLSERCWKYMNEIAHLEEELEKLKNRLEAQLGCESGDCKTPDAPADDISSKLQDLTQVEQQLSCTEDKKKKNREACKEDLTCTYVSSLMGMSGYVVEKFVPKNWKPANCHMGDDSCVTQFATGFLKAVIDFFQGSWDLLKMGGKWVGKKAGEFWNKITGGDDHASSVQLGMAKASEEEGVFDMLTKDFTGTMSNIFSALVASVKEWMKNDLLCSKWEGTPHFSKCLEPAQGFDCLSCKSIASGICAGGGLIVAEIVPAFLTGGLVTAAKHGAKGAATIAKLFKISDKTRDVMKGSKAAKMATETAKKTDEILKVTKGLKAAKVALQSALKAMNAYLMSPLRKALKASHGALTKLTAKGKVFLAETSTGKFLVFGGKGAKFAGKVVIYPIENPMTVWAFKKGEQTFAKVLKLGSPKLKTLTVTTSAMTKVDNSVEPVLAKIESVKMKPKVDTKKILKLEEELHGKLTSKVAVSDAEAAPKSFKAHPDKKFPLALDGSDKAGFINLITPQQFKDLPDGTVLYGITGRRFVKGVDKFSDDVRSGMLGYGFKDSQLSANAVGQEPLRTKLMKDVLKGENQQLDDIIANLYPELQYGPLAKKLGPDQVLKAEKELLEQIQAMPDGDVKKDLLEKLSNHMAKGEARSKIVGNARPGGAVKPEDAFENLKSVNVPDVNSNIMADMLNDDNYQSILLKSDVPARKATARSLKLLEDSGMSRAEAAAIYRKNEKYFKHVQSMEPNSDAQSLLAEYIRREKAAGIADDVIEKKLADTFKGCE